MVDRLLLGASDSTDPFGSIKNFFHSSTWHFAVLMFWFFLVVVWLACAYWVYKDARRRIDDRVVIIVAVLTGLVFGPFGLFVYAILRPPEYLDDTRERELELRMLEQRLDGRRLRRFARAADQNRRRRRPRRGSARSAVRRGGRRGTRRRRRRRRRCCP